MAALTLLVLGFVVQPACVTAVRPSAAAHGAEVVRVAPPVGERQADRTSILAALEEVQPGGTILFAPGTYLVGEIIRVSTPGVTLLGHPDGTTLRGCHPEDFVDPNDYFSCNGLELAGARQTVRGFTFEYMFWAVHLGCCFGERATLTLPDGTSQAVPALYRTEGGHLVEGNTFRSAASGVRVNGDWTEPAIVRSNRFLNNWHAVSINGHTVHFLDNDISVPEPHRVPFFGFPWDGIKISPTLPLQGLDEPQTSACVGNIVEGNHVEGHIDGIRIELYLPNTTCRGNVVRNNTIIVRRMRNLRPEGFTLIDPSDSTFVGVPISLLNEPVAFERAEPGPGTSIENNVIEGNRIIGAEGVAIEVLHASRNRIANNTISGVITRDPFPGNTMGPRGATGTDLEWRTANGSGIWISPGSEANEIVGNIFTDIAAHAVVLEGDRNRVETRSPSDVVRDLGSGNRMGGAGAPAGGAAARDTAASSSGQARSGPGRGPVIDMHLHAAAIRSAAHVDSVLAWMDRHGVARAMLLVHDTAGLQWHDRAPDRFILSVSFPCHEGRHTTMQPCLAEWNGWPDPNWLRRQHSAGRLAALGELLNVYYGIPVTDERLAPYFALAEELDIPVGVHTGRGPPPERRPPGCCPNFDDDHGNPALLEPVLRRHPRLRVWLMHAGGPFLREAIALMRAYPNVYADMSILNSMAPVEYEAQSLRALLDAGLGDRIMLGTDNQPLERILERMDSFDFLDEAQRRAILYDNAARFLRLRIRTSGAS